MKKFYRDFLRNNLYFWIFAGISIILIVVSFILPPAGAIDPSVALAVGELFGFASLGTVIKAMDDGKKATVRHNNTSLTIGDTDDGTETAQEIQEGDIYDREPIH